MAEAQKHVLIVDDDPKIRRLLRNCFEPEGLVVLEAQNGDEVAACLEKHRVDLVTLDLNLGIESGLTIVPAIKAKCNIPIIIVTGKGDVIDRVAGLELGADDYITKPFHVREVIARVRSVLRRAQTPPVSSVPQEQEAEPKGEGASNRFQFENWLADLDTFELTAPDGTGCELTTADFKLLKVLLENPKRVLSREQIMDQLSGHDWMPYDRTIDNQIARLRKKLEDDPSKPQLIKTVRGIGYTFTPTVKKIGP